MKDKKEPLPKKFVHEIVTRNSKDKSANHVGRKRKTSDLASEGSSLTRKDESAQDVDHP